MTTNPPLTDAEKAHIWFKAYVEGRTNGIPLHHAEVILSSLKQADKARGLVEAKANECRQNRPQNYTHGYVCGYLDGVSTLEKALTAYQSEAEGM